MSLICHCCCVYIKLAVTAVNMVFHAFGFCRHDLEVDKEYIPPVLARPDEESSEPYQKGILASHTDKLELGLGTRDLFV